MFNRSAPPNFRGLHPDLPIRVYYRNLPHWRQLGATYFVTFRLADALPQSKVRLMQRLQAEWERANPLPRTDQQWEKYVRQIVTRGDAWLDEGYGACLLQRASCAAHLEETLMHFQDERYFVSCWTVMPNHCHLLICPNDGWELEDILKGIKGVAARRINATLSRQGSLWQEESYDRIVRDEEHLWRCVQYIGRNPQQAGLPPNHWRCWIDPRWEQAGWRFRSGDDVEAPFRYEDVL